MMTVTRMTMWALACGVTAFAIPTLGARTESAQTNQASSVAPVQATPQSSRVPRVRHRPGSGGDPVAKAQPGDVRLIVTGSIDVPIEDVRDDMEQKVGRPLVIQYGSARGNLKDLILRGQGFEVAILLPDVTDELRAAGKITAEYVDIARVNIGIGLRGDVSPMDVSTPAALKAAILGAKGVEWSPTGAAVRTADKLLDRLEVRDRVTAVYGTARRDEPLGPGEYHIHIYPLSELLSRGRARSLGPVIPEFQVQQVMRAVISADTPDRRSAEAVIAFLQSPALNAALAASGMTR